MRIRQYNTVFEVNEKSIGGKNLDIDKVDNIYKAAALSFEIIGSKTRE